LWVRRLFPSAGEVCRCVHPMKEPLQVTVKCRLHTEASICLFRILVPMQN
jgi:hypothetical protein